MAKAASAIGIIDVRSAGILRDYVHSHEPCAPGAAAHARRRMFEHNSMLNNGLLNGGGYSGGASGAPGRQATVFAGSLSNGGNLGNSPCAEIMRKYGYGSWAGGSPAGPYATGQLGQERGGGPGANGRSLGGGSTTGVNGAAGFGGGPGAGAGAGGSGGGGSAGDEGPKNLLPHTSGDFLPPEEDEDMTKYDRFRDWLTCFGAVVIVACVLGIIHSYAVFAPSIQHHYETGLVETIVIGTLTYTVLVMFIPVANLILECVEHRRTAVFGMLLMFIFLILDALTIHRGMFYACQLIGYGIGGSLAYQSAMTIVSGHFRKYLDLALCVVTCAGSLGTIFIYLISNLMLNFISYLWTKLCLAVFVLLCMGACQTFPSRPQHFGWFQHQKDKRDVKDCLQKYVRHNRQRYRITEREEGTTHKTFYCVCVCDISIWTDYSFMLWAALCLIAIMTAFVPYLFLEAFAMELGTDNAVGLVCYFCIASMVTRLAFMTSNDHTFKFNRTLFQASCIGSGVLYIFFLYAETYGWVLVWGLAMGALEGVLTVVIPRITLQTVPFKWLGTCWTWCVVIQGLGIAIGPILLICVYSSIVVYGPALVILGVTQIVGAVLAFLLPDEEQDQLEDLEAMEKNGTLNSVAGTTPYSGGGGYGPSGSTATNNLSGPGSTGNYGLNGKLGSQSNTGAGGYPGGPGGYPAGAGGYTGGGGQLTGGNTGGGIARVGVKFNLPSDRIKQACFESPYTDCCPICSKIGCITGCHDCLPGGLSRNNASRFTTLPMPCFLPNSIVADFGQGSKLLLEVDDYLKKVRKDSQPSNQENLESKSRKSSSKPGSANLPGKSERGSLIDPPGPAEQPGSTRGSAGSGSKPLAGNQRNDSVLQPPPPSDKRPTDPKSSRPPSISEQERARNRVSSGATSGSTRGLVGSADGRNVKLSTGSGQQPSSGETTVPNPPLSKPDSLNSNEAKTEDSTRGAAGSFDELAQESFGSSKQTASDSSTQPWPSTGRGRQGPITGHQGSNSSNSGTRTDSLVGSDDSVPPPASGKPNPKNDPKKAQTTGKGKRSSSQARKS